eukprot:scaffold7450_cov76-Phaeocystis_antarctica.AAC.5
MQLSSSEFVVASSRRPTPSCWARARQLGGSVAPAASTLSSRSRARSERDKSEACPRHLLHFSSVIPEAQYLQNDESGGEGDGGGVGGGGAGGGGVGGGGLGGGG